MRFLAELFGFGLGCVYSLVWTGISLFILWWIVGKVFGA